MSPSQEPQTEIAVRKELLRVALGNSARSVPLQLVAVVFIAWLAWDIGHPIAAAVTAVLGLSVAAWRLRIARLFANIESLAPADLVRAQHHLEGNSALAGAMWIVYTAMVYPSLQGTTASTYVVIICGSVAVAAFFMSLVGRAFLILTSMQLGALTLVSVLNESAYSMPLAVLAVIFGLTMLRATREFREATTLAIRHGLEADEASNTVRRARDAAEAANLAKSQFLATMSHEIRTPMNGVLGALDLLRRSPLDSQQKRLVKTAASSGESLMAILNDVLDHSKIEAGKLQLTLAAMSLHALAASVAALFRANAESKGLSLEIELEEDLVDWVIGDAQRLKQVLFNLVGNAIKFTESGGVTLRLTPRPAPIGRAGVVFEVRDTGIGISEASMEQLFQPFHQIDGTRNRRRGGTGLGLTISQRIVAAMGGVIVVDSRPNSGSRFRFTLDFEIDPAPSPAPIPDSAMGGLSELHTLSGTVLVVEDNAVNRMIALEMLQSLGIDVIEAEDGAQAVEQLARRPFDLVLMDCQMPVMDGYAATERIRQRETEMGLPRTPIVALTADAFDEDTAQAAAVGMDAHLAKPYTRAQLLEMIRRWL
jgi:signal transduction histidine kinase/CheY-like chemotaxis protein